MKRFVFSVVAIAGILLLTGCPTPNDPTPISAGYAVLHTANTVNFNMHYVPSGGPFTMGEDVESTTQEVTLTKNCYPSHLMTRGRHPN